jgi:potassium/hydrogen antiporter
MQILINLHKPNPPMNIPAVFAVAAALIFLGFLSELIFKKTNIPDVIFLIGTGIIIGTFLGWVTPVSLGNAATLFTTFALIFLLFQGALNINFKTLVKSLPSTLRVTLFGFIGTTLVTAIICLLFGYSFLLSLLIGTILGGTSSAVVIPLVKNIKMKEEYKTVLKLESAISDVLCIVTAVAIIEIFTSGTITAASIFKTILSSFALAIVVGVITGSVWIMLLKTFKNLATSYMLTIAVVIGLYAFTESPFVGASGAIAALSFGLMLGNSKAFLHNIKEHRNQFAQARSTVTAALSAQAKNFYAEISFFVKTFFFIYLGILMDFSNPLVFLYGALLTAGIYLSRPYIIKLIFRKRNIDDKDRTYLEIMIPKGLAAAVLTQVAVQSAVPGAEEFVTLILSVILLSILLTSCLTFLTEYDLFKGFLRMFSKSKDKEQ